MEINSINELVVLFEDDEKSLNYKYQPGGKNLKSTKVLSVEYDKDKFSQFELIGSKPEIGSVYYKHPYKNDVYVNSNLTDFFFIEEKLYFISHIVKLLGAKSFEAELSITDVEKLEITAKGEMQFNAVEVSANYREEETKKLMSKLALKQSFVLDDSFDRNANYRIVVEYFNKYNLSAENSIKGIIHSRDPYVGNQSDSLDLKTELTSEYNRILDSAAGLSVMGDVFNLNSTYKKQFESIKKVNLSMKVNF